jgi:hypothetical protein
LHGNIDKVIDEYVRVIVDAAPPLTDEQRERITAALRRGGIGDDVRVPEDIGEES